MTPVQMVRRKANISIKKKEKEQGKKENGSDACADGQAKGQYFNLKKEQKNMKKKECGSGGCGDGEEKANVSI